jgi:aryl-alcohol dehydrogenase-like predicted oxidoreductase
MTQPVGSRMAEWKDTWKRIDKEQNWNLLAAVQRVAKRRETTAAAVSLAWLLARPEVSSIIVGARTVKQLDDNLQALTVKLGTEDVKELDEASKPEWGYPYSFIGMREAW